MSDTVDSANDKTTPKRWEEHFKDLIGEIERGSAQGFVELLAATAGSMLEGLRSVSHRLARELQDMSNHDFRIDATRLLTKKLKNCEFDLPIATYLFEVKWLLFVASRQPALSSV